MPPSALSEDLATLLSPELRQFGKVGSNPQEVHTHTSQPASPPPFRPLLFSYSTEVALTVSLESGGSLTLGAREAPRYPQFTLLSPSQVTRGDSPEFRPEQGDSVCPKFDSGVGGTVKEYHLFGRKHMASVPLSLH